MRSKFINILLTVTLMTMLSSQVSQSEVFTRIKDISRIKGLRNNQLIGYGLVVGLEGTGDSSTQVAAKSIANFLNSFGVKIDSNSMKGKNIAAVSVTAILPPFAKQGDQLDVTISSIGDAKSLQGGMLLLTPLKAPNNKIYAVAQGAISIGGFNVKKGGASAQKNHATIGRIPNGAILEKDIFADILSENNTFEIVLRKNDFSTATSVAQQINIYFNEKLANVKDPSTIEVYVPEEFRDYLMLYIARIEQLSIVPDVSAKIIINERTGTILMGGPIKILPVAVAHGNLTITIKQPPTKVTKTVEQKKDVSLLEKVESAKKFEEQTGPQKTITVLEENVAEGKFIKIPQADSINDVVRILNTIGASPRDMITILQSMKNAGALQAELEII